MTGPYVPLRVFSCFTMLEGAMEPKAIAAQSAKLGFPAVAVTDRNGLYAAMPFTDACIEKGVQPIIGAAVAVRRPPELGDAIDWIVLLAHGRQIAVGPTGATLTEENLRQLYPDAAIEIDRSRGGPRIYFTSLEE